MLAFCFVLCVWGVSVIVAIGIASGKDFWVLLLERTSVKFTERDRLEQNRYLATATWEYSL